jgi:hypothetical protein
MMLNAISKLKLKMEKEERQLELEAEIEKEGIFYKWSDVGRTSKLTPANLKKETIVRYKDTKIIKFSEGNIVLCKIDGCYSITKENLLCAYHLKGKNMYHHCTSKDICVLIASFGYENKKPLYCLHHKETGAFNVVCIKCTADGCLKRALFGNSGKKYFAANTKTQELLILMVDLVYLKDVIQNHILEPLEEKLLIVLHTKILL